MYVRELFVVALSLALGSSLLAQDRRPAGDDRAREQPAARPSPTGNDRGREQPAARPSTAGDDKRGADGKPEVDPALVAELMKLLDANHDGKIDPAEAQRFHAAVEAAVQRLREQRMDAHDDHKDVRDDPKNPRADGRWDVRVNRGP
jgi:hypothetical protein